MLIIRPIMLLEFLFSWAAGLLPRVILSTGVGAVAEDHFTWFKGGVWDVIYAKHNVVLPWAPDTLMTVGYGQFRQKRLRLKMLAIILKQKSTCFNDQHNTTQEHSSPPSVVFQGNK